MSVVEKSVVQNIVVTDLDGTLLDHHSYEWQAAKPALEALKRLKIPVIINTSKTTAEVTQLLGELNLKDYPFVVENGSALILAGEFSLYREALIDNPLFRQQQGLAQLVLGDSRSDILRWLEQHSAEFTDCITGYKDWNVKDIASITGLPYEKAKQSATREYSEPFLWTGSESKLDSFKALVKASGMSLLQGGRFFHLQGGVTKSTVLEFLRDRQTLFWPKSEKLNIIALGDGHNDVDMLNTADTAICIKSPVNDFPRVSHPNPIYSRKYGPEGWNEEILKLLNTHNL